MLISGCGNKESEPITQKDIYSGTDGIVFNFLKNTPQNEVFSSYKGEVSQFDIIVELQNKGAFDVKEGLLTLVLESGYMEIEDWPLDSAEEGVLSEGNNKNQKKFNLDGRSLENLEGDGAITSIKVNALEFPETLSETHTSSVLLTSCYNYQTRLYENVCIDTDVYNLKELDKVCNVKDLSLSNQGAPISIISVEVDMLPQDNKIKPIFTINVENVGGGEVILDNDEIIKKACSSETVDRGSFNKIHINAYLSQKEEQNKLDCTPTSDKGESYIKLDNKKGLIRCSLKEGTSMEYGTYMSPLIIELDYGYMQTIAKDITIKKPVTY